MGTAEIIHAANRGENFTVIFINNTGLWHDRRADGCSAASSGQVTTTTPYGRNLETDGNPIRMAELMALLDGTHFSARVAVDAPKRVAQAGKIIHKAFEMQKNRAGFAFVEVLAACPTNWGLSPLDANERISQEMMPCFPLGTFKDLTESQN
ncbi:MAG: thiamine pyrophosphate-dependent enzyme [Syntrophotaleaceae bacterium]